jgi:transposase
MPKKLYDVHLTPDQRQELEQMIHSGTTSARKIKRANMLLLASESYPDAEISQMLRCHPTTVERIRKRFVAAGLAFALEEKPRPGQPIKMNGHAEAYLVALACSKPPDGRNAWTMELLAEQLIERRLVESISDETVRLRLKKTKSNPGNAVSGALLTWMLSLCTIWKISLSCMQSCLIPNGQWSVLTNCPIS